jgi:hypothetical protein
MLKQVIFATAILGASPASATVFFSENFDSYTPSLNFAAFNPPGQVINGTVDVVANGSFGITCAGGSGNCLDMDGSTGDSGVFTFTLTLGPGSYVLSFDVSGNQRGGTDDWAYVLSGWSAGLSGTVGWSQTNLFSFIGFQPFLAPFSLSNTQTLTFSWSTASNDNVGPILDNVLLVGDVIGVPEPAMLGLFGLGLAGVGLARRRR